MSDIVERLCAAARPLQHMGNEEEELAMAAYEAADEIERLRAKNEELRGTLIELRLRLQAQGRRSFECHELHMIDEALR